MHSSAEMTDEVANVHVNVALDIIRALYDDERTGVHSLLRLPIWTKADLNHPADDKKTLCQFLSKLVLSQPASQNTLFSLYLLATYLPEVSSCLFYPHPELNYVELRSAHFQTPPVHNSGSTTTAAS